MAFDPDLAVRVRRLLGAHRGLSERKMFGGICFLLDGKMCSGVLGSDLVVRVAPQDYAEALRALGARPMDFTGRPMRGFVFVGPRGFRTGPALAKWLARGVAVAREANRAPKKNRPPGAGRGRRAARL